MTEIEEMHILTPKVIYIDKLTLKEYALMNFPEPINIKGWTSNKFTKEVVSF